MKNKKIFLMFVVFLLFFINVSTTFAAGKKIVAKNKYIWIYVDGERKIIPEKYGFPCYGQGRDNKNTLYIPLNVIAEISGNQVSPLMKSIGENGEYSYYADIKGTKEYRVIIGEDKINDIKLASAPFILKGTAGTDNKVIMVPLGFAIDGFGLKVEVKRPIGRGVYDYCSLAINFSGENIYKNDNSGIIDVPNNNGNTDGLDGASNELYYVHSEDDYYHKEGCSLLEKSDIQFRSKLSEFEVLFWGYTKCPECFKD